MELINIQIILGSLYGLSFPISGAFNALYVEVISGSSNEDLAFIHSLHLRVVSVF